MARTASSRRSCGGSALQPRSLSSSASSPVAKATASTSPMSRAGGACSWRPATSSYRAARARSTPAQARVRTIQARVTARQCRAAVRAGRGVPRSLTCLDRCRRSGLLDLGGDRELPAASADRRVQQRARSAAAAGPARTIPDGAWDGTDFLRRVAGRSAGRWATARDTAWSTPSCQASTPSSSDPISRPTRFPEPDEVAIARDAELLPGGLPPSGPGGPAGDISIWTPASS